MLVYDITIEWEYVLEFPSLVFEIKTKYTLGFFVLADARLHARETFVASDA